jgi:regulator of RNase E activity RraA
MSLDPSELCARYRKLYLPAVADAIYREGGTEQVLPSTLRPLFPDQRVVGFAVTVVGTAIDQCSWEEGVGRIESYLRVFDTLQPDDVLVSVNGDSPVGHFGELTGNAARHRGCAGVILDGNLRDVEGLRAIGLQVFYRDLSPLNAIGRWEMAASNVPVRIGQVEVHPGDLVFAEFDGILVIPRAEAESVLAAAEAVVTGEQRVRADMRSGASPADGLAKHGYI